MRDHVTLTSISCSVLMLMTLPNVRPTGTHQGFLIDLISFFQPAEAIRNVLLQDVSNHWTLGGVGVYSVGRKSIYFSHCGPARPTGVQSESTPLLAENRKEVQSQWQTLTCSMCPCVLAYSSHTCEMSPVTSVCLQTSKYAVRGQTCTRSSHLQGQLDIPQCTLARDSSSNGGKYRCPSMNSRSSSVLIQKPVK